MSWSIDDRRDFVQIRIHTDGRIVPGPPRLQKAHHAAMNYLMRSKRSSLVSSRLEMFEIGTDERGQIQESTWIRLGFVISLEGSFCWPSAFTTLPHIRSQRRSNPPSTFSRVNTNTSQSLGIRATRLVGVSKRSQELP